MPQSCLQRAQEHMAEGRSDRAIRLLQKLSSEEPDNQQAWKLLGFACHDEQLEPEAAEALGKAVALDPNDVAAAMAYAQSRLLAGLPASDAFRNVLQLAPEDFNAVRGYTDALLAEGRRDDAEAALRGVLAVHGDWLAGHKALASLRYTAGDKDHFADSYEAACLARPENLALRLDWFRIIAQSRDWEAAAEIIEEGERIFGAHPQLLLAKLFIASESGNDEAAARLFGETESLDDVVRDMALVRYSLRRGALEIAEAVASRRVETASAAVFWPYLSLIWRLSDDPRAEWLEGEPNLISSVDLDLDDEALDSLARLLREMHRARRPYLEQSVRGGTQTDLNLFLRHEPILRDLKKHIEAAVRGYVERLPAPVPDHPLLGVDRSDILRGRVHFSGSWSVRLKPQGYNVSHTHPVGVISSALYVSLPEPAAMGEPPAGWIQFGTPPPELNLALEPYKRVEPKTGRLVLFPSTMWHSTVPFEDGERLVVAFDVRAPRETLRHNQQDQPA